MSRIGKQPVIVPSGVSVTISDDQVSVTGTKGSLTQVLPHGIKLSQADNKLIIERLGDGQYFRANHGLIRALLNNMVTGVSSGFSKKLEVNGVGYRVSAQGNGLKLNLGYSHDVNFTLPEGTTAQVEQNVITINGIDKQKVGQVASEIRALRKPEPYKGKGIQYQGEYIIRKSGKSGKEKA